MSYETEGALRVAAYEAEKERDALRAENETLKEHLADTRRMLLWLRNHYELYDYKRKDAKTFRAKVIARVDKIIPSDDSEPDYSDIPHKGIHP